MSNVAKHTYTKMNQDISRSKFSPEIYYEGKNIRILTNEAFGSVTNAKGNELKATIPVIPSNPTLTKDHLDKLPYPLQDPVIVGHQFINEDLYVFSKYPVNNEFAKLFYSQVQSGDPDSPGPYIDSNIRVLLDTGNGFETFFENFDSTNGAIEGPSLPTGTPVRIQAFSLSSEPNEPAPDPHLYLDVYINGELVETLSSSLDYINTVTLAYDFITDTNTVYFFHAYSLPSPGSLPNPFTSINIFDYIVNGDIFTIYQVDSNYNVILKFIDEYDIGNNKVDVWGFYENEFNQKLYWANGEDPLSFINIADPNVLELNRKFLSTVPNAILTQPEITGFVTGGSHTSGSIQYAYNLYKLNGAQTKISPLSIISYLNNGDSGNDINVRVDKSIRFKIEGIDDSFDRIKIYSIKYTSKDSTPEIKNIFDLPINNTVIELVDDNNAFVNEITFTEFVLLGGEVYIPKHLQIKDNRLFLLNYKTKTYDVDFDARAYRFDSSGNLLLVDTDQGNITSTSFIVPEVPETHNAINPTNKAIEENVDWNKYIWKSNGVLGGKGPNVAFEIKYRKVETNFGQPTMTSSPTLATVNKASDYTSLKSGEVYRMFIEFQLEDGRFSFPKWVADIKIPEVGTVGSDPTETDSVPEPPAFRTVLLSNPPGFPTSGDACAAQTTGLTKYIEPTFAITNGLIIYNDPELTNRTYSNDPYSGNFAVLIDVNNNLKYAVRFDANGVVDVVSSCGSAGLIAPNQSIEKTYINYCYIETELLNIPNDPRIKGWRTSIVERTESDKSVITQGVFNPVIEDTFNSGTDNIIPSYFQRTVRNTPDIPEGTEFVKPQRFNTVDTNELILSFNNSSTSLNRIKGEILSDTGKYKISNRAASVYSPEIIFNKNILGINGARMRKVGLVRNTFTYSNRRVLDENGARSTVFGYNQEIIGAGATLLAGLSASTANNRTKISKFISDNKDTSNNIVFGNRLHSYVRYFGGVYYPRNVYDSENNISVEGKARFIPAVQNIFSITDPDTSITYNKFSQAVIPVFYETGSASNVVYRAFTGSNVTVVGIPEEFMTKYSELDPSDLNDFGVLVEFYRVVQNQYGGDSYTARQSNRTIPYSNVRPLIAGTKTTEHQGDTFIQKFNFLKTFRVGNDIITSAEIVSVPVETSINLDLRWDILKNRPDNFEADELTSYGFNPVYNQLNNTIKGVPKPDNFTELTEFPVNIITSKLKVPGELIDSFTDFLVNDIKSLSGLYGEITGVGEHSDNVFAFQRNAVAYLAINPRVQLQTNDTIPIELGSGGIIERYQYLTTNSGTLNKWSVVKTNNGLMYVDLLNKSINFIGADNNKMSTVNGLYNKLFGYVDTHYSDLIVDNPVINKGIISYYDNLKEETYFTFLTADPFTVSYNGLAQGFVSFYDFFPTHYMTVSGKMITTDDNIQLWEHNTPNSLYNVFYEQYFPSYITILTNQYPDTNKIFDNIHFNSEFYNMGTGLDLENVTFTKLQVFNEYQNTGTITIDPTVYRALSKRRLRKWNFIIPRSASSRDRISNPWAFIRLEFDKTPLPVPINGMNIRFVLHDLLVSFTPKP